MAGLIVEVTKGFARKITAAPMTADGKPAELDGPLGIRQSGPTNAGAIGVADLADPLSVWVEGTGDVGDTNFEIFADKRKGPDVVEIVVPLTVHVKDPEAASLGLTVSEEVPVETVNQPPTPTQTPEPGQ